MSGTKRTLNNEENLDNTDQNLTPDSSPESKRLRHDSSHSESKDEDTQILDSENGFPDDQSSTSEDDDSVKQSIEETISDYALVDAKFDNGENDKFRYDGQVKLYIRVPTHPSRHEIISSPTIIRTLPWTLLGFFQRTFNSQQNESGKTFSLFLKCNVDASIQNWSIFAKAEVTLLHPTDPSKNYIRKISHIFNSRSEDWGYNNFKLIKDVYSEYIHPSDHTIRIEANIHADPPRNIDWDSKGQTDFNGLRNIGATCYMNSFLQTIYFTKKLRKAVYTLPTDNDDQQHSIPLALQKVFYDLQFTDKVVSTRRLSRSFGWDKPDEFCQHDIQEFCRVLLDKLESKMQGTTMEGIIPSLYQGEYVQYVRCTNVDYESRVIETFYDVPLQVRNNQNITESFRDFCKKEILTGENLYDAGDVYGLQEAEKGVRFLKFPPVLCLHLLRFEYDYTLSQNRKINDNYSFDYQLDLSEFLEKPDCSSCSYKLLSVLVHSGDNSSGHYVSFLNPNLDGQWFKFDDDIVAHVSSADAMERNFGGVQDDDGTMFNTSAYMLVYIREDCQNDVLCEINFEHIPETLMKRFDNEKVLFNKRRANGFDNSIIDIPIILNDDFYVQPTACLSDIIHETSRDQLQKSYEIRCVKAQRNELFRVFAQRLAYELGVNLDEDIRIWFIHRHGFYFNNHCHSHPLQTYTLVHSDDYDKKLVDLIEYDQVDQRFVPIYIEQKILINGSYQLLPYDPYDDVLVFVRLYNSRDESLLYIGHFLFPQQQSFQKCLNEITNRMKYPSSSSMNYLVHRSVPKHNRLHQYEAIKSINYDLSVSEILHPCSSGTSIIIQIYDSTEIPTTTVDDYLENLENRQEYDVWNRDSLKNECLFKLYLPLKASVKDVIRLISQRIDYPEEQIILQKPSISTLITNTLPSASLLHIGNEQILKDFYTNTRVNTTSSRKLTFKRLPFHYTELENRRLFRLNISDSIRRDQLKEFLFFPKSIDTISDFLNEIKQWIPGICSENVQCQLRIIELNLLNHVNPPFELRIFSEQTQINELNSQITRFYHLEEVSSDDIEQNKDIALIPVAFFVKENSVQINRQKFFPFFLHVIHNETYADVKHRLQRKLGLSNREFEKYRFSIYNGSKLLSKCDDNIGRINLRELKPIQKSCWLGVESPVITNSRKTRKSLFTEKPIRIN